MYALSREDEPKAVLTAIVITVAALGTFAFVAFARLQSLQAELGAGTLSSEEVAGWNIYRNDTYGFQVSYPPGWTLDDGGLLDDVPYVAFGNPMTGPKTYTLQIFIENNTSSLSSGEYVHALLDADKAQDAASGASAGRAPAVTPQFEKTEIVSAGGAIADGGNAPYEAYELYGVFEFDHTAEKIYVAHGALTLRFDFPVAEENPNISLPVANNAVAHQIVDTLVFTK
jgi:hypothetical protein